MTYSKDSIFVWWIVKQFYRGLRRLFKRECKHKHFEAVESLICRDDLFYHRFVVYKCLKCGVFAYSSKWAFGIRSGALDLYFPKHKSYVENIDTSHVLSETEYTQKVKGILGKYLRIEGNRVYGIRLGGD